MLGKILLALVFACAIGISVYTFTRGDNSQVTASNGDTFLQVEQGKRGDDPLYSEEIRKNTALTMQARDRAAKLEKELQQLRQEKAASDRQNQQQIRQLEGLIKSAAELAKKNSTDSATSPAFDEMQNKLKAISDNVESLTANVQATAAQNNDKITQLETALKEATVAAQTTADAETMPAQPTPAEKAPPEKSAVTYAYGVQSGDATGGGIIDSISGKISDTFDTAGNLLSGQSATQTTADTGQNLPTTNQNQTNDATGTTREKKEWQTVFPVYTLPPNTVLTNSTLITPIIGRVPLSINGSSNVSDPFFFKVEVGAENLTANGQQIPGVAKMIASGYATGVREQSCVRGYIDSLTFIFIDGRIVTQGSPSGEGAGNNEALGYLADTWGKPCIRGRYINNGKEYLMSRGMAAFIEAAANGLSQSQTSVQQNTDGSYQAILDGNVWSFILGQGIGGSASEIAEYVRERTANAFDVVYVEQSKPVQIWLNTMIPIDYDSKARKISYYDEPPSTGYYD